MIVPEPRGPGGFLARPFRKLVCQILTCLMNINVKAIIANNGVSANTVDAKVTYSPSGVTAELDLTTIAAGSSGGGGYMGELDDSFAYTDGQTFTVTNLITIGSITWQPGYWGILPTGRSAGSGNLTQAMAGVNSGETAVLIVPYCV